MTIKTITKQNGSVVYRKSVYLGVDKLTGKKARTTVTASTKKGVKAKERDAINKFIANGCTLTKKANITTYDQLAELWWDSYKNTVKPNTKQSIKGIIKNHLLILFCCFRGITTSLAGLLLMTCIVTPYCNIRRFRLLRKL